MVHLRETFRLDAVADIVIELTQLVLLQLVLQTWNNIRVSKCYPGLLLRLLTEYPGGLVSEPRGQGQVEELLPQPGVPTLLLLDHDQYDHPECVEEDQEPRTQP